MKQTPGREQIVNVCLRPLLLCRPHKTTPAADSNLDHVTETLFISHGTSISKTGERVVKLSGWWPLWWRHTAAILPWRRSLYCLHCPEGLLLIKTTPVSASSSSWDWPTRIDDSDTNLSCTQTILWWVSPFVLMSFQWSQTYGRQQFSWELKLR